MLKIKDIALGSEYRHGYGAGAKPGMKCEVDLQLGDNSYDTVKIKLPDEAIKRIVSLIAAETLAIIASSCSPDDVDIEGAPGLARSVEQAEMPVIRRDEEVVL